MRLLKYIFVLALATSSTIGCDDSFLDLDPIDSISADALFSSEEGIKAFMANLYSQLPIEDFNSTPNNGISFNNGGPNNAGAFPIVATDDGMGSEHDFIGGGYGWWNEGYVLNKDINLLFDAILDLDADESTKDALRGEAYFLQAYTYFALAKRYGGVPIITEIGDISAGEESLMIPRSTEKETWDFVLESCDQAAALLGDDDGTRRRASKWVALALKSRAALYAASVAKFWDEAPLSGDAVDQGLVGMSASDANGYYAQCISASEQIINSGNHSLYKANPANPDEAAENYREMFEDPNRALNEAIFIKGFTETGAELGSNQDNWGNPAQTNGAWPHPGRFNPTLDLVDIYENYSTPGQSAPIVTTVDGDVDNYNGYQPTRTYLTFDNATDIFADKDARLRGTVILPRSIWKGVDIIIQAGIIGPDGSILFHEPGSFNVGGAEYYSYGASAPNLYSGYSGFGGNMTRTGFGFKKFLNEDFTPILGWNQSTTDWMDFRLAEIYLNYAEAAVESGLGDQALAATAINALRQRAGHTSTIPLTLDNVLRERRVELVYENHRNWDLTRRRAWHTEFNNRYRHSLAPVFDTRTMKYIFIRERVYNTFPKTFFAFQYYKGIPGISANNLVQNPQY